MQSCFCIVPPVMMLVLLLLLLLVPVFYPSLDLKIFMQRNQTSQTAILVNSLVCKNRMLTLDY